MRRLRSKKLLLGLVVVGAAFIWALFPMEPVGRVFHEFRSPDGRHVITVYRYVMPIALPGGGGSDAPGRIELTTADGHLLHKEPVPMVILAMDEPEWSEREVRLGGLLKTLPLQ
ncbi:hypothetical protein [uncultured Cohaesibacter sp.]|uniref:hypothetical protein n=1 Tax=uncultured Cohaesibacter sp. TaxID=1002546 RepID=UPI0029C88785|nr:hypothetical protein [uncultured Cohaesibacter sp.]